METQITAERDKEKRGKQQMVTHLPSSHHEWCDRSDRLSGVGPEDKRLICYIKILVKS